MTWFDIYAVLAPLQILVIALAMIWITGWLDAREDRRNGRHTAGE